MGIALHSAQYLKPGKQLAVSAVATTVSGTFCSVCIDMDDSVSFFCTYVVWVWFISATLCINSSVALSIDALKIEHLLPVGQDHRRHKADTDHSHQYTDHSHQS